MPRSKKIFLAFAVVFFLLLFYTIYDLSTRTTFPGSKTRVNARLKKQTLDTDTVKKDTSKAVYR